MDKFRDVLVECGVEDVGYEGDKFTWRNNNHTEEGFIRERLDRVVANNQWRSMFPSATVNSDQRYSDHRPLIIDTQTEDEPPRKISACSFNFEAAWLEEETCRGVVEKAWAEAKAANKLVAEALGEVSGGLSEWSRNVLGDLEKTKKK